MTVVNVEKLLVTRQCWFSARLRWSSSPNVHFDEAQCRRRGRIETKDYMKTFAFQERLVSVSTSSTRRIRRQLGSSAYSTNGFLSE